MMDLCKLIWCGLVGLFRSRALLQIEILALRRQLNILRRNSPKRLTFGSIDRIIFSRLYGLAPDVLSSLAIVRPDTVIRWHRAGFRLYWRWKSGRRCGRPAVTLEIRRLICEMSIANPLWGAPRIHGELLKLGIDIGQTCVGKYMVRRRPPPSQGWKTFLRNPADGIAAMDLFVVPSISFRLLYGLLIMGHGRRQILWFGVTAHPSCRMDRQLTDGGVRLGANASLPDQGSRWRLRRDIRAPGSIDRHSRSPDFRSFTLAKRIRRKVDRLDPHAMH
jgi:hypothetical protein